MEKKDNPGTVENLLMKMLITLCTWLLTQLLTHLKASKFNGEKGS